MADLLGMGEDQRGDTHTRSDGLVPQSVRATDKQHREGQAPIVSFRVRLAHARKCDAHLAAIRANDHDSPLALGNVEDTLLQESRHALIRRHVGLCSHLGVRVMTQNCRFGVVSRNLVASTFSSHARGAQVDNKFWWWVNAQTQQRLGHVREVELCCLCIA